MALGRAARRPALLGSAAQMWGATPSASSAHQVGLRLVLEEREVAPRDELDGHARLLSDVEQGLDELVGNPGVDRPSLRQRVIRAIERRR